MRKSVFLFLLFPYFLIAQVQWEKKLEKDGIILYTADKPGSNIKQVKSVATLDCSPEDFLKVLMNFEDYPNWGYSYLNTRMVKKKSENFFIIYTEYEIPWPMENRDVCFSFEIIRKQDGTIIVDEKKSEDIVPVYDDLLRMPDFMSYWELKPKGNGTDLLSIGHAEPGGSLPAWIINMFIEEAPVKSLKNMYQKCLELKN